MSIVIDTPDGIAFARAAARAGALSLEVKTGLKKRGQTAYSIVKEVYGFRGTRQSVLDDLNEYIAAELRLKAMSEDEYKLVSKITQDTIDHFGADITQLKFEQWIEIAERRGAISHAVRQGASDLFYVAIVRQNAAGR